MIYRSIIALVLYIGLDTSDLKLLTAIVVAIALSIPVLKKKKVVVIQEED
jgi:putative ABC transport system permease protein